MTVRAQGTWRSSRSPLSVDASRALTQVVLVSFYVAVPLANAAGNSFDAAWVRAVAADGCVLLAAYAALILLLCRHRLVLSAYSVRFLSVLLVIVSLLAARAASAVLTGIQVNLPVFMELQPVVYGGVAVLLVSVGALPDDQDFARWGGVLGAVLIALCIAEFVQAGGIVRPDPTGEINYEALLLAVSYAFTLRRPETSALVKTLILAALALTLSRTAILALIVMELLHRPSLAKYAGGIVLAAAAFYLSMELRGLDYNAFDSMARIWIYLSALVTYASHPMHFFLGFPWGQPIDAFVPEQIEGLWWSMSQGLEGGGIYPFHYHIFFLRFTFTWGAVLTLLLVWRFCLDIWYGRRGASAPITVIFVASFIMSTFYLSSIAVVLFLAYARCIEPRPPQAARAGA